MGATWDKRWFTDRKTGRLLQPRHEVLRRWLEENEVTLKDADSLTSDWLKYGVDRALSKTLEEYSRAFGPRRHLYF